MNINILIKLILYCFQNALVYKLAIHLKTSGQEITKLKSLQSMISNILKNKFANKNTPDELKAAIKADYRLANKILNVMNTLQIININSTKTKVDVFKHKIEEIAQMERISDEDQFEKEMNAYKEKIKNTLYYKYSPQNKCNIYIYIKANLNN